MLLAVPASAHAVLLQTTPGEGAVLTTPPKVVSLRYDEQVTYNPGAVRVYNQRGSRVDTGSITKQSADVVQVGVRPQLPDGAYVVTWRVISADTHPVEGAFTFQVGLIANATAPNVTGLAQNLLHNQKGSKAVGVVYGIARGTLYTGIALLIGGVAFSGFVWSGSRRLRRAAQLLWAGWILTAVVTVAEVLLQGIYGAALVLRGHLAALADPRRARHVVRAHVHPAAGAPRRRDPAAAHAVPRPVSIPSRAGGVPPRSAARCCSV